MSATETNAAGKAPLLSIAIPTYNRAHWLRFILPLWLEQAAEFPDECEVVVSDNASEDDTPAALESMKALGPLRIFRNETNIDGGPNIHKVVTERSRGEFILAVGDDDFPTPGTVGRMLEVLRENPDLEYVYVNYAVIVVDGPPTDRLMSDILVESVNPSVDFKPRRVERLGEVVGQDMNCFTPIGNSLFRRSHAQVAFNGHLSEHKFTTAYSVSSHALYVAENLLDKPAYYSGHPWLILSSNSTWPEYQPIFALKVLPDVMDTFVAHGADKGRMAELRRQALKQSWPYLARMFSDPNVKHKEIFSLRHYLWRHRGYVQTWIALARALIRSRRPG